MPLKKINEDVLAFLWGYKTVNEIAAYFNTTLQSVRNAAKRIGIYKPKKWRRIDTKKLLQIWKHKTDSELAQKFGVTEKYIKRILCKLGLRRKTGKQLQIIVELRSICQQHGYTIDEEALSAIANAIHPYLPDAMKYCTDHLTWAVYYYLKHTCATYLSLSQMGRPSSVGGAQFRIKDAIEKLYGDSCSLTNQTKRLVYRTSIKVAKELAIKEKDKEGSLIMLRDHANLYLSKFETIPHPPLVACTCLYLAMCEFCRNTNMSPLIKGLFVSLFGVSTPSLRKYTNQYFQTEYETLARELSDQARKRRYVQNKKECEEIKKERKKIKKEREILKEKKRFKQKQFRREKKAELERLREEKMLKKEQIKLKRERIKMERINQKDGRLERQIQIEKIKIEREHLEIEKLMRIEKSIWLPRFLRFIWSILDQIELEISREKILDSAHTILRSVPYPLKISEIIVRMKFESPSHRIIYRAIQEAEVLVLDKKYVKLTDHHYPDLSPSAIRCLDMIKRGYDATGERLLICHREIPGWDTHLFYRHRTKLANLGLIEYFSSAKVIHVRLLDKGIAYFEKYWKKEAM
jgi:hypothetical protein